LLEIYPLLIQIPDVFAVLVFSLFHFQFVWTLQKKKHPSLFTL
jgi:hypothetical protein